MTFSFFSALRRYTWAGLYALGVLALAALLFWWQPSPPPAKPVSPPRSEPVREAVQQLLADEWLLNEDWSVRAGQWPGAGPMPEGTRQTLQTLWPELVADVEALQKHSATVLRLDQVQGVQVLLQPYLGNAHPETRALATELHDKLQALLTPQAPASDTQVPLSWGRLERVAADMDRMQFIIRDFKRMSLAKELPDSAKLPMRLFVQLSLTFPTAVVSEFVTVGNRLVQRRWSLLYQLEKDRVVPVKAEVVAAPPEADWTALTYLLLAGVVGTALLARSQQQASQWERLCHQGARAAEALQAELRQARQAPPPSKPPEPLPAAPSPWMARLGQELPDLRGRIKNVQLRFDAGLSLDAAAQDLMLIDAKLSEWDQHLASAQADKKLGALHG